MLSLSGYKKSESKLVSDALKVNSVCKNSLMREIRCDLWADCSVSEGSGVVKLGGLDGRAIDIGLATASMAAGLIFEASVCLETKFLRSAAQIAGGIWMMEESCSAVK